MNTLTEQKAIELMLNECDTHPTEHVVMYVEQPAHIFQNLEIDNDGNLIVRLPSAQNSVKPLYASLFVNELRSKGMNPVYLTRREAFAEVYKAGSLQRALNADHTYCDLLEVFPFNKYGLFH